MSFITAPVIVAVPLVLTEGDYFHCYSEKHDRLKKVIYILLVLYHKGIAMWKDLSSFKTHVYGNYRDDMGNLFRQLPFIIQNTCMIIIVTILEIP